MFLPEHLHPKGVLFSFVLFEGETLGENLLAAYREYLENQYQKSEDLVVVDLETVPTDQECSLSWLEFADFS